MPTRDAPGPRANLPVNAWAILGLLSFGTELTGYQLRQWAENVLGFFHSVPAMSQIYTELRRLEQHGYARGAEEEAPGGRARRAYRITPEGRAALAAWIDEEPVEQPTARNGAMLRLWLGAHASPERLRGILREHRDRSEAMRADAAFSHRVTGQEYPGHPYASLVTSWAERRYAAERDIAEQVLAELERLEAGGQEEAGRTSS
ncbi:PadR family transcriptional regulator [Nocardiopsis potens]|uniref:PadR family transcriptional regulator n=1 Tax=Nocardiopsis potens TaxID=1246458 RepID=UPI0003475172|nr:PadR family transcriptional regulator [Nocardiopsis potens]